MKTLHVVTDTSGSMRCLGKQEIVRIVKKTIADAQRLATNVPQFQVSHRDWDGSIEQFSAFAEECSGMPLLILTDGWCDKTVWKEIEKSCGRLNIPLRRILCGGDTLPPEGKRDFSARDILCALRDLSGEMDETPAR